MRNHLLIYTSLCYAVLTGCAVLTSCATPPPEASMMIAHLGSPASNTDQATPDHSSSVEEISAAFAQRNPGYALSYSPQATQLTSETGTRIVFVQHGKTESEVGPIDEEDSDRGKRIASKLTVGDLVVLHPHHRLTTESPIDALVFDVPEPTAPAVPTVLRPDWDEGITDTPGGCATEAGAYRRVVLTWMRKNGPYNYRALNAHRVRITDSFTHYHPVEGGFDEFYLVQMVRPGARIITSNKTDQIIRPDSVTADEAQSLLQSTELKVGDLVYLPRGVIHRGLGGVLAHVITTPGFVPGAEIGVDHYLRQINERLKLQEDAALPYHAAASVTPVVR